MKVRSLLDLYGWAPPAHLFLDGKRKASDEPGTPTPSKRLKDSYSTSPQISKAPLKVVSFPEKVLRSPLFSALVFLGVYEYEAKARH